MNDQFNILITSCSCLDINVGDEGGFAPDLSTVEECLDLLVETISNCGFEGKVAIALDVAASGN